MGLTGKTNNKLFKVKRVDINEPYKVGVNNVTNIDIDDENYIITYILDDIKYITFAKPNVTSKDLNTKENLSEPFKTGKLVKYKKIANKLDEEVFTKKIKKTNQTLNFKPDLKKGPPEILTRRKKVPYTKNISPSISDSSTITDTFYITEKFSFDTFVEENFYKKERYTGLISKPIVTSDVFMERDTESLFERQQRLSEINNLSELINYRNGYFNVTNTF